MNSRRSKHGRPLRGRRGAVATLIGLGLALGGCDLEDQELRLFRDTAATGVQAGLVSIFSGFMEGAFAVVTATGDEADDTPDDAAGEDTGDAGA